jgi:cell division septal protein FtsQ
MVASNEQISSALKSEVVNSPLFVLDPNELENRVKNLSMIKHAFIRRYLLPHPCLKVEVLEEFPWATLYGPSPNLQAKFVVAESGRLISLADFPNVYKPALKIYVEDPKRLHLAESDVEQWANWTNYISKQTQCPVVAIDMLEPHNIKVETSKFSLVLGNPDSGLPRRLYRLAAVLEALASQHKEPIYVNLSLNSNIPVKLAKKSDKLGEEKVTQL